MDTQPKPTEEDQPRFRQIAGSDYWFPLATKRCKCCGYMMADIPALWSHADPYMCRICANPVTPIKVVHDES